LSSPDHNATKPAGCPPRLPVVTEIPKTRLDGDLRFGKRNRQLIPAGRDELRGIGGGKINHTQVFHVQLNFAKQRGMKLEIFLRAGADHARAVAQFDRQARRRGIGLRRVDGGLQKGN
jgi:hypothetical protein